MKKIGLFLLSTIIAVGAIGCSSKDTATNTSSNSNTDKKIIKIGASPVPHKDILERIKPALKEKGYELEIVEFTDYVTPNTALEDGELDANFFQHTPYLNKFNQEKKTNLVAAIKVHIEPMGVYSSKVKNLKDLRDGAEIAIPNDPTNGSRALKVLEDAGLIKVKSGELISKLDITENKKNIKIKELDAPQLPRVLKEVDAAVINTNYAIEANLNPVKDSLAMESKDSPYANVIAVKKGTESTPYIKALCEAITSPEIKKFIEENYKGNIVPSF